MVVGRGAGSHAGGDAGCEDHDDGTHRKIRHIVCK